jgi:hypothetical protein
MDGSNFDNLARLAAANASRRSIFTLAFGAALAGLGAASPLGTGTAAGKNRKRRRKRKKPKLNAFGCLNGGQACGGKDGRCCSGICQGKKPKKGKTDKSRCAAHHNGGCTVDRHLCLNPTVAACSAASDTATCLKTTGNAAFCAEGEGFTNEANCQPCRRDLDCEALGFGVGAACVIFRTEGVCVNGCEGINESTGTACLSPAVP